MECLPDLPLSPFEAQIVEAPSGVQVKAQFENSQKNLKNNRA